MYILNWESLDNNKILKVYNDDTIRFLEKNNILPIAKNQYDNECTNDMFSVFFITKNLENAIKKYTNSKKKG